jgi:hypothetical protein
MRGKDTLGFSARLLSAEKYASSNIKSFGTSRYHTAASIGAVASAVTAPKKVVKPPVPVLNLRKIKK